MGGVDKLTVADVDTHVRNTGCGSALEEDQITGTQVGLVDGGTALVHGCTGTGNRDAVDFQDVVNKAGAVKAAGRGTAINIGYAQILLCIFQIFLASG